MNYYLEVLQKYADFNGRAMRIEYWMFALFNFLAAFVAAILDAIVGSGGIFLGLYILAIILPSLAVSCRRLHDTNRSGWWQLIGLIPFGGIVLLVFYVQDSTPGTNQYGPNPKGIEGPGMAFAAAPQRDVVAELERLSSLKERGAITEEEYNQQKAIALRES